MAPVVPMRRKRQFGIQNSEDSPSIMMTAHQQQQQRSMDQEVEDDESSSTRATVSPAKRARKGAPSDLVQPDWNHDVAAGYSFVCNSNSNTSNSKNGASSILGEGGFSTVKSAVHVLTGTKVAIKCMDKVKLGADLARVKTEIHALRTLGRHEAICRLYQVIETPSELFLVTELCQGGELFDFIVKAGRVSEESAKGILLQLLRALSFIHSKGFAHRDLKPENILLKEKPPSSMTHHDLVIKLIDFGLAADCTSQVNGAKSSSIEFLSTCCGSPAYAAPELISGSFASYSGRKIDVWSSGIITFALLVGSLPFEDSNLSNLYSKIMSGKYHVPSHVSSKARDFISRMLQTDPAKRWSVQQLLAHPFLKGAQNKDSNLEDPLPVKVTEVNLDEEILWFVHERFFPSTSLSSLRKNIQGKNGYETATYWLVRDHALHKAPKLDTSAPRVIGGNLLGSDSPAKRKIVRPKSLHASELDDSSTPRKEDVHPIWSRYQHVNKDSANKKVVATTPSGAKNDAKIISATPKTNNNIGAASNLAPRTPISSVRPSPSVYFLSVPAKSTRVPYVVNHHPASSNNTTNKTSSSSPGHALSPLSINSPRATRGLAGAGRTPPSSKVKRHLMFGAKSQDDHNLDNRNDEELQKTPLLKFKGHQEHEMAATTSKKNKFGRSKFMSLFKQKLLFGRSKEDIL